MRITRRQVLAMSGLAAVGAAAGAGAVLARWWDQAPGTPYRHLSTEEAAFLDHVAELVYPEGGTPEIGGRRAQVSRFLDEVWGGLAGTQRRLLRLSFHALDALTVPTHGAHFSALPVDDARDVFRAWLQHARPELRGVAQSLHIFVGGAYLSHPEVAPVLAPQFSCGWGR